MKEREVYISGLGSYSPGSPVPFDQIEDVLGKITEAPPKLLKRIERMRPVMKELLGIEYSYYALDPKTRQKTENNVSMCVKSANIALERAELKAEQVDLIVYAGILYDYLCPPSSVLVQDALNIPYCAEIAIHSNCTAIYKALQVAADLVANGRYNNALVVTSQLSSAFLRSEYYNQKMLTEEQVILRWFLSDGAGAVVVSSAPPPKNGFRIVDTYLESVGVGIEPTMRMLIGAENSILPEIYDKGLHHLTQDIKVVSKLAPTLGLKGFRTMVEKTGLDVASLRCFFANVPTKHLMDQIIKDVRSNWNNTIPFYTKLATRGYQGAPAIIIALDEYMHENDLKSGDTLASFVTESSKWMHAGFILEYCS